MDLLARLDAGDAALHHSVLAIAPGRVNLIGEHVDYSGFSVLPAALETQRVRVAAAFSLTLKEGPISLRIANSNGEKFSQREWKSFSEAFTDASEHDWTRYARAGVRGALELLEELKVGSNRRSKFGRMDLMIDGSVPAGAGLSSSSALVVACFVATLGIHGCTLSDGDEKLPSEKASASVSRARVAQLAAACEQYVGVQGGGMDQAISLLAQEGCAMRIDFVPSVSALPVSLPSSARFVVANSLVTANKYASADTCYNKRVVECRLAAVMLAKKLEVVQWRTCRTLRATLEGALASLPPLSQSDATDAGRIDDRDPNDVAGSLIRGLKFIEAKAFDLLQLEPYSISEVAASLQISADEVRSAYVDDRVAGASDSYELRKRALHVFAEARRVYEFQSAATESSHNEGEALRKLGRLMDESHASCRDMFECSCPELDALVEICRVAGAAGARLTGAGWGGCVVALVPVMDCTPDSQSDSTIESFINTVREKYYGSFLGMNLSDASVLDDLHQRGAIFATSPGAGASLTPID